MDEQGSQGGSPKKELTDKEALLIAKGYVGRVFGFIHRQIKKRTKWNLFFTLLVGFDIFLVLQYFSLYFVLLNPVGFYIILALSSILPLIFLNVLLFHFVSVLIYIIARRPDAKHLILCVAILIATGSILSVMQLRETAMGVVDQIKFPDNAKISEEQALQFVNDCRVYQIYTKIPEETKITYTPLGYMFPPTRTAFLPNASHDRLATAVNGKNCNKLVGVYYSANKISFDEVKTRLDTCSIGDVYYDERDMQGIDLVQYNNELATIYVNGPVQTQVLAAAYKAQAHCPNIEVKLR